MNCIMCVWTETIQLVRVRFPGCRFCPIGFSRTEGFFFPAPCVLPCDAAVDVVLFVVMCVTQHACTMDLNQQGGGNVTFLYSFYYLTLPKTANYV